MESPLISQADYDHFCEAERLLSAPSDSFTEPYSNKYAAKKLYLSLGEKFRIAYEADQNQSLPRAAYGYILTKIGQILIDTEESSPGEEKLVKAKELLEKISHLPVAICAYMAVLNQLGCLHAEWSKTELAEKQLSEAERIYNDYKSSPTTTHSAPLDGIRLAQKTAGMTLAEDEEISKLMWNKFEEIHTFTLYFLAQVFKNKGDFQLAAKYCQSTLMRQLQGSYDPVDWALNAAHLSQFYLGSVNSNQLENICDFHMARHCLAAAVCMIEKETKRLEEEKNNLKAKNSDKLWEVEELLEKSNRTRADVYRLYVKYGVTLLQSSKDRLISAVDVDDILLQTDIYRVEQPAPEKFPIADMDDLENQICAQLVATFTQARDVFLRCQKYLKEARGYYSLNEHCRDHCELVQDSSKLYGLLAFFESDLDRKAKMHRRRVEMLKSLWKELNPTYYLHVCRQLLFEMGETLNELVDIKRDRMEEFSQAHPDQSNVTQVSKVNSLITEAVENFQNYLKSHEDLEGKMPQKFSLDDIRPVVLSHLYMGRLLSKWITPEPRERLEFCEKSLEEYRWIVDYCTSVDPDCVGSVQNELDVCRDMCTLLPAKMDQIRELITT